MFIVVFDLELTTDVYFGPFSDEDEARTFITCGPHDMEEFVECAEVAPLNHPNR